MRSGFVLGFAVVGAACSFQQPTQITCDSDEACPGSLRCDRSRKLPVCVEIADASTGDDADVEDAETPLDAPPDAPPLACPSTYTLTLAGETRYRVGSAPRTWTKAALECSIDSSTAGTHLIVLSSLAEDQAYRAAFLGEDMWVGLSDRVGTMRPVTDEPTTYPPLTSPPWATAQPSNDPGEDCVVSLLGNGDLDDIGCDAMKRFVCECDAYPDDPSNY